MNHQTKTTRPATDGRPRYYGQRLLYYAMAILSADLFLLWAFFVTLVQDTCGQRNRWLERGRSCQLCGNRARGGNPATPWVAYL
ncbi:MAG TPA: hypothetical protein IAA93_02680 [Candidatus Avibacteroides avistercoris]|uniref:Uncharacterized protein n=1 Tax=Candidatus Avibacteroides avistercoris TaxID=2840690 RepID=A0A9D2UHT5_9BACT|nr:hypothetical protein [Candidatus Avibacteroides avistercoris]